MSTPTKRIAFHTLGCKLNYAETASISREFIRHGFEQVDFRDKADIYVLNTCSVTENADKESRKIIRSAKKRNPESAIAVIGCYAQLKPEAIAAIDGVDLILGTEEKFNLLHHLSTLETNGSPKIFQSEINQINTFIPSYSIGERTRSFLKIQDGCDYTCSFCTIPLARGGSRSQSIKNTLMTATELENTKTREVVLTGVNIGDFGKGRDEKLIDLIRQLEKLKRIDRFRISSIEPNLLTDEIIEFCINSQKLMPHFHIPLQSGSDKILSAMRRRYKSHIFADRIKKIKSLDPECCIGVDVIVGFPGESEEDFLETYHLLNELDISYLHVFTYSQRPNTDACEMNQLVPRHVKAERSKMLHILSDKKRRYFQDRFIGKKRPVLFEFIREGYLSGHTDNYIKVEIPGDETIINSILDVTLFQNLGSYMEGKLS